MHRVAIAVRIEVDGSGYHRSLWSVRSDCLREEDGDHTHAETARAASANYLERGGSAISLDYLVRLPRGRRH